MKFNQKLLIAVATLFVMFSNICSIILVNKYNDLIIKGELTIAQAEMTFLISTIKSSLDDIKGHGGILSENTIKSVIDTYSTFYDNEDVALEIIPQPENESPVSLVGNHMIIERHIPDYEITLEYMRNIDSIYTLQDEWNHFFMRVNIAVSFILVLVLFFVIKKLTSPLALLSLKTDQIMKGNYADKIVVFGNDEFSELGLKFNSMMDEIQAKVNELENISDEKQMLVDSIAHELKTPLTSLQGYSETLLKINVSQSDRATALAYIHSEAVRIKELVEKLLSIAVIGHNTISFNKIITKELLESVSGAVSSNCKDKNIKLNLTNECEFLFGDESLISALLINLVNNAVNASPENEKIDVSIKSDHDIAIIQIGDHGCGLTKEQIKKIFEPFYRANKDRSRATGGTGLGLTLCKKIVNAHGGSICVTSELNKGTNVRINLQLIYKSVKTS